MIKGQWKFAAIASLGIGIAACQQQPGSTAGTGATTAGGTSAPAETGTTGGTTGGTTSGTTGATTVPNLVNVSLRNVLNNLSVTLHVEQANIPVNAQVPIDVAASVCGVSVSALAASIASGQAGCTATTTTPQLTQAVQQQIASGGSVTGGDQNMGTPTNNNMM